MGLIKAIHGSFNGVMADQWKEYFYCESMPEDVLVTKGQKRITSRSSNRHGSDNVITNGSVIAVADGQCMILVDQGAVTEICAQPGEFLYNSSTQPSIFYGGLGKGIVNSFKQFGKRIGFGGEVPQDQRIYYFNTKELVGNKYGTHNSIPVRIVDQRAGIDLDVSIKCYGEYSYKISDPILFYHNVCGNVEELFMRDTIDGQLKAELLTALQPAFSKISGQGIRYSQLPDHADDIAAALQDILSQKWNKLRGITLVSFGISSIKADDQDERMIKDMQRNSAYRDPTLAAATLAGAQADAMRGAANNQNSGAFMGFAGMNMAQNVGGFNPQQLYQMGQGQGQPVNNQQAQNDQQPNANQEPDKAQSKQEQYSAEDWTCPNCGTVNNSNYNFCHKCGFRKNNGTKMKPIYRCSSCGWKPDDPTNPPEFCPICGNPFGNEDIVKN